MDTTEQQASGCAQSSEDNEDEKEELRMPTPPLDWAFNNLLIVIANEMTREDLEQSKAMFKGIGASL